MHIKLGPFEADIEPSHEIETPERFSLAPHQPIYHEVMEWFAERPFMNTAAERRAFLASVAPKMAPEINLDDTPTNVADQIMRHASPRGTLKAIIDAAQDYKSITLPSLTPQQIVRITYYTGELSKLGAADLLKISRGLGADIQSGDKADLVLGIMDHAIATDELERLGALVKSGKER